MADLQKNYSIAADAALRGAERRRATRQDAKEEEKSATQKAQEAQESQRREIFSCSFLRPCGRFLY